MPTPFRGSMLLLTLVAPLAPVFGHIPCNNTWQLLPPALVDPNPIFGMVYDPSTQSLYQSTEDGSGCHALTTGAIVRLRSLFNVAGSSTHPEPGGPLLSTQGFVAALGTRYSPARFRDSANFCTSDTFNYTNAVAVVWQP